MSAAERTVYVTNLEDRVDEDILDEIFTQSGPVASVSIIPGQTRYAFVQFLDECSVSSAIMMMDGLELNGVKITVRPRPNTYNDYLYKLEQKKAQRRHGDAANNNVPDYKRRSWGLSRPQQSQNVHPSRYNQGPSHVPMHTAVSHHDAVPMHTAVSHHDVVHNAGIHETPTVGSRIVGGYYQQPPRNSSEGGPSHSHANGYKKNTTRH